MAEEGDLVKRRVLRTGIRERRHQCATSTTLGSRESRRVCVVKRTSGLDAGSKRREGCGCREASWAGVLRRGFLLGPLFLRARATSGLTVHKRG